MLTKTLNYFDHNLVEQTSDFHFNLSPVEVAEFTTARDGDGNLSDRLLTILTTESPSKKMALISGIVEKSYGQLFEEDAEFVKTPNFTESFKRSRAYYSLCVELFHYPADVCDFVMGVLPQVNIQSYSPTAIEIEEAAQIVMQTILSEVVEHNESDNTNENLEQE